LLAPGLINPGAYYNTTSPVQSQFNWSARGLQTGDQFNPAAYNAAATADQGPTPWGLQELAQPLSYNQMLNLVTGNGFQQGNASPIPNPGVNGYGMPPNMPPGGVQPVGPEPIPTVNMNNLQNMSHGELQDLLSYFKQAGLM
jgi:hypothetical protein